MNIEKIEKATTLLIEGIGENTEREGLLETPKRVAKAWSELLEGYTQDDKQFYKTFSCSNNNLIIVKDIEFTSYCEHHLMPFQGVITIGYIPNKKVLGISKFGRIVDCFAKRLQIQEKLVKDIGDSIFNNLQPLELFVIARATHSCMMCRGIKKEKSSTISIYKKGNFNDFDLIKLL
jgi:GTP cyclohydrolase I